MKHILALDQGTSSSRALVFDQSGAVISVAQKEFTQHFPQPGWVEHDAEEIWSSQLAVARDALVKAGLTAKNIAAIGITNQRETTVVWDRKTGAPVSRAIVWQDRRTAGVCQRLRDDGFAKDVQERTGLVVDAYFSGTKARWILENVRDGYARAETGDLRFGTIDSWLVWKLTKGAKHVTDVSNASRTMLFNIHRLEWDPHLAAILKVPTGMLPEARSSSEVYGETDPEWFGGPIPIAGIAGDQQAALFGQACHQAGFAKNTYGTGCFMLMHTGDRAVASRNQLLTTVAWKIGDKTEYALEGSVFNAGTVVQWLRDQLGFFQSAAEIESLAGMVEHTDGVYFVPAFTGLGAPYWDPYARGSLVGLTRGTTKAHIARAALESIAWQTLDVLQAMRDDSGIDVAELRVDGGASANDLLMQFQSDVLQTPVVRPTVSETTSLGAAYLAGLTVGYWASQSDIQSRWQAGARWTPKRSADEMSALAKRWKRAVETAKGWDRPEA